MDSATAASRFPPSQSLAVGALLTALTALGQVSTALYVPSLPSMGDYFHTDNHRVALTMTVFLVGFAVSQLVYGPLADRYGRRPVLLGGLTVYLLASAACATAGSIDSLIAWRFLQATGACSGQVVARAVVRDVYGRERAAKVLAYIGAALAISPAVMPALGGVLQGAFGWRAAFVALAVIAGLVLFFAWRLLGETRPADAPAEPPSGLVRGYGRLLVAPVYLGYVGVVACVFAGLMAYVTASPFLFIDGLGLSPEAFGLLSMFNVVGFLAGTLAAGRWSLHFGVRRMTAAGLSLSLAGSGLMVGLALAAPPAVPFVVGPMAVFLSGLGIVMANGMAGALANFPRLAGTASALLGCLQMLTAAAASLLAGHLDHVTALSMAGEMLTLALMGAGCFGLVLVFERKAA
ncbi:MAG: multidrug effflux MFS transporter [Rhodobacterales bacterium]|nr:multidrug effflux MFS transporter [Rhodobacterales bacterium]